MGIVGIDRSWGYPLKCHGDHYSRVGLVEIERALTRLEFWFEDENVV